MQIHFSAFRIIRQLIVVSVDKDHARIIRIRIGRAEHNRLRNERVTLFKVISRRVFVEAGTRIFFVIFSTEILSSRRTGFTFIFASSNRSARRRLVTLIFTITVSAARRAIAIAGAVVTRAIAVSATAAGAIVTRAIAISALELEPSLPLLLPFPPLEPGADITRAIAVSTARARAIVTTAVTVPPLELDRYHQSSS
jgi:hypothetical protein